MRGPFSLSTICVDLVVAPKGLGVYALSNSRDSVEALRRTNLSVREELKAYVKEYRYFWFDLATSDHEAYNLESEEFHSHRTRKTPTITHPHAPADSDWHCPVCHQ